MITVNDQQLDVLFDRLWPICRSITGPGISESLDILREYIPIEVKCVPTGRAVFDWVVPQEWALERATLSTDDGVVILDTDVNNLHVLNYSEPFFGKVDFETLSAHLHTDPDLPEAIPYVTSYYAPRWGLCLTERQLAGLRRDAEYIVDIKTKKFDGFLRYGDITLVGESSETILITSYLCHPSMANNELSGPLALVSLYSALEKMPYRRFSYRFVIVPETIGSVTFLANTPEDEIDQVVAGIVLTCLGGPNKTVSFKHSRRHWLDEESAIDDFVEKLCQYDKALYCERDFTPTCGSDERQFCSPAVNLPVVQAAKTVYGDFDQYHTSLDDKSFMRISSVVDSVDKLLLMLRGYELEHRRLVPKIQGGEPMLGKRGLYPTLNSTLTRKMSDDVVFDGREQLNLILNVISLIDGKRQLSEIVEKLNTPFRQVIAVIEALLEKDVITYE
ncbi:MAG: DUF4910 domain-containing protein [Gammaproteobacteria bacterium]|nr:DUF4910 domain-containing protein [Gammaproteobacteria bacterium]